MAGGVPLNFHEYSFFRNRQSEVETSQNPQDAILKLLLHGHNLQFPHASLSAMEDSCSESSASSSEFDGGMYDDSEYAEMMPKDNAGVCFSWMLGLSHLHLWRNLLIRNLIYCWNAKLFPYNLIQSFKTSTLCNLWFVFHTAIWVLQSSNFSWFRLVWEPTFCRCKSFCLNLLCATVLGFSTATTRLDWPLDRSFRCNIISYRHTTIIAKFVEWQHLPFLISSDHASPI